MQTWAESSGETPWASWMENLRQLREDAFEKTARHAVEKSATDTRSKEAPLEPGDLVINWLDPNEKAKLRRSPGRTKAAPLWSGPCRVVRKLTSKQDTYANWDQESAQAALKELLADLKAPPKQDRPSLAFDDSVEEIEEGQETPLSRKHQRFLQELTTQPPTTDHLTSAEIGQEEEGEVAERERETKDSSRKKKKTKVQCVAWGEVERLLEGGA